MDDRNFTSFYLSLLNIDNFTYNSSLSPNLITDNQSNNTTEVRDVYFLVGMLSVFSIVGTFGNGLIIYIFSKMLKHKLTSTVFILTLGGTDFFTCLITIPSTIIVEYYEFNIVYDIPCKIYMFFVATTVPYSSFIMVVIAVDRYLCICRPFLRAMNIRRAKIIVISLACALSAFGTIIAIFHGVYIQRQVQTFLCPENVSTLTVSEIMGNQSDLGTTINRSMYYRNVTNYDCNSTTTEIYYTGICDFNTIIFSMSAFRIVKYVHSSFYVLTIGSVFILYGAILRRVLAQNRSRGGKNPCGYCCSRTSQRDSEFQPPNGRELTNSKEEVLNNGANQVQSLRLKTRRGSKKGDKMFIANLKIAGTLFTVALVFFLAFFPAWLMALKLIPSSTYLFYSYFVYNIANPVIYAFLNPTFRKQLKNILPCIKKKAKDAPMTETTLAKTKV